MSALAEPKFAWEPLTPRGVAAFARASCERLFVVQSIVALLAATAVILVLSDGIFPVVTEAIDKLPTTGFIQGGRLDWHGDTPTLLAEGNMIALTIDLEHGAEIRSPADFQLEFGRDSLVIVSLLGETEIRYPADYIIAANQRDARPAWGAWSPDVLALAAIGTFLGLMLLWAGLATLYCVPVWIICFFANRDLSLAASWRLAGAALLPGALLLSLSLVLYERGSFDLVQLGFAYVMHLVVGWTYLFVSPLFLNRVLPADKRNPFAAPV